MFSSPDRIALCKNIRSNNTSSHQVRTLKVNCHINTVCITNKGTFVTIASVNVQRLRKVLFLELLVQHHNPDILCICGGENWVNCSEVDFYKNLEALCLISFRLRDTQSHGGIPVSVYRNGVPFKINFEKNVIDMSEF